MLGYLWKLGQRDQRIHRLAVSQNDDPLTMLGSLQVARELVFKGSDAQLVAALPYPLFQRSSAARGASAP